MGLINFTSNTMLNKEHITRGEATSKGNHVFVNNKTVCVTYILESGHTVDGRTVNCPHVHNNAAFIAEAFNVLSETDKTPRELLNDFTATEEALLTFFEYALDYIPKADIERFKKLLNK